jgi:hypothetical protein
MQPEEPAAAARRHRCCNSIFSINIQHPTSAPQTKENKSRYTTWTAIYCTSYLLISYSSSSCHREEEEILASNGVA